jgi:four helix bundle protein
VSNIGVALEEADETVGWLELLIRSEAVDSQTVDVLLKEARELVRILAASRRTTERDLK